MTAVILRAGMCRVVVTDRMHQDTWWPLPLSVLCTWSVQERAPILHGFMAWDMKRSQNSMSCHAKRLLELLLDLAQAAYVPAHLQDYKGLKRRMEKGSAVEAGKRCKAYNHT